MFYYFLFFVPLLQFSQVQTASILFVWASVIFGNVFNIERFSKRTKIKKNQDYLSNIVVNHLALAFVVNINVLLCIRSVTKFIFLCFFFFFLPSYSLNCYSSGSKWRKLFSFCVCLQTFFFSASAFLRKNLA